MAHGLDEDEDRPERNRRYRHERQLRAAVGAPGRARREHREDERERRHHDQRREAGAGPLHAEDLLVVGETADQDAQAHDTVADDHHRGVDRLARQGGHVIAAREHHRENQRGLDDGHGHGEDQRPERFAHAMRDDLGVMHGGDDRPHQTDAAEHGQDDAHAGYDRDNEQTNRQCRHEPGPERHEAF
jgi:hypothetical protein